MSLVLTQALTLAMQQSSLRPAMSADAPESSAIPAHTVASEAPRHASLAPTDSDVDALLAKTLPQFDLDPTQLPARFRKRLVERLHEYTVLYRSDVQTMLERASLYLTLIRLILQEQGLPWYFAYLPLVESRFLIDAVHPKSGAAGLWQLMPITARGYGLRVTKSLDERLEPVRATRAAAGYLRELQDMFGTASPLLLLAAYNYGENNLSKTITRARTRDIWELFRARHIPYQTREYLLRIVALWVVIANADDFRFTLGDPVPPSAYTEINFSQSVPLATISHQIDMSLEQLRALNPHLLTSDAPAGAPIRIPAPHLHMSFRVGIRLTSPTTDEECCAGVLLVDTPPSTSQRGQEDRKLER